VATSFRVIGNAIPPTLGRALALQVMKAWRQGGN
jgi:site-specific DNA-cytosine methylase